jgi:predicted RNA binding protein YcfA (HicA-like mRNA interferase family)
MSKLPRISGRECVKALERVGFYFKRQTGSHIILRRDDPFAQVVVPDYGTCGYGPFGSAPKSAGANLLDAGAFKRSNGNQQYQKGRWSAIEYLVLVNPHVPLAESPRGDEYSSLSDLYEVEPTNKRRVSHDNG